jgi:hypothetical protein
MNDFCLWMGETLGAKKLFFVYMFCISSTSFIR